MQPNVGLWPSLAITALILGLAWATYDLAVALYGRWPLLLVTATMVGLAVALTLGAS